MAITLVQSKSMFGFHSDIITLDSPPTPGNYLVLQVCERTENNFGALISGWTMLMNLQVSGFGDHAGIFTRVVDGTDTGTYDFVSLTTNAGRFFMSEWSGVASVDSSATIAAQQPPFSGSTLALSVGPLTPSAGIEVLLYSAFTSTINSADPFVPDGAYTQIDEGKVGSTGPSQLAQYRIIATTSGSYSATATLNSGEDRWCAALIAFSGEEPEPPPDPEPGVFTDAGVELTDVIRWTVTRGSSPEVTGGATIGAATIIVKNTNDQYNPENPAGILYPDLRDGLGIWIGINNDGHLTGADPRGLFAGRIKDITLIPAPGASEPPTAEIVCEDPLGWYGRTPVNLAMAEGQSQGVLRTLALQSAGETRYDLDHEITTMQLAGADGTLLSVLEDINKANGTRHFIKPADNFTDWYAYTTRNRQWRLDATVDASLSQIDDHVTSMSGWRLSADTVTNQQKATTTPIRFTAATVEVWRLKQHALHTTDRRPYDAWIEFDDYVREPHVDVTRSGNTPTIVLTAFGDRCHLQITNGSGQSTTFSRLTIEGALARRLPNESHVADDLTSQALPRGIRAGGEISNAYVGILESASGIAEHVVWRYGNPQIRPTLTVENWFPDMFDIDLYDLIAYTSPQLSATDRLFEIVGLTHQGNVASPAAPGPVHHTATYVLQECAVQADPGWFYLDNSDLDSAAILAY